MNKNRLEWTIFGISLALIAAVVSVLLYEHFTSRNRAADLQVVIGDPVSAGQGYAVPIDLRNAGDTSAEDVRISVTLTGSGPEASDVTIPYVPYRSSRRGWVVFSRDPRGGHLDARVLGYREP